MGRKERKGFEYFNLDVDAGQDPKMYLLMRLGGCSAVCCWFFLLMETYKKGGCLPWGEVEVEWFAARYSLTVQQVKDGIKALCDAQLISKRVLGLGYITSRGIQLRAAEIAAKIKRGTPSFPQGTEITDEDDDLRPSLLLPDQTKEKETKLNSTKLKEIPNYPEDSRTFAKIPEDSRIIPNYPEDSRNDEEPIAIAQAPTPKKAKAVISSTEGKTLHGQYVWLSEIEHEQFTVTHGDPYVQRCIEKLDSWIATDPTPKRIKNGRHAAACFRSWVLNAVAEEQARAERVQTMAPKRRESRQEEQVRIAREGLLQIQQEMEEEEREQRRNA